MNIAAILPHVGVFGGVRRFLQLGNELVRRGHEYALLHPDGGAPGWMPFAGRTDSIERGLRGDYDVAMCGDPGVFDAFARVRARARLLFILGPRYAPKYRAFLRPGLTVVGVNDDWVEWLPGVAGHTVAGGVDTDVFRPVAKGEDGASGGVPFRILSFGRVEKKVKGLRYLLSAMRRVRKGARLALYDHAPIRMPWTAWGIDVETHVGLAQEALARLYASADLFVSPEISAGWSNPVAEAMACGAPVVCTPAGSASLARDGETALVVPREDARALAAAIERLRGDPDLRARIAAAGLRRVQEFTWPKTCDRLLQVLDTVHRRADG